MLICYVGSLFLILSVINEANRLIKVKANRSLNTIFLISVE